MCPISLSLSLSPLSLFSRTHCKHERLRLRDAAAHRVCLVARHLEGVPGRQGPFKARRGGVGGVATGQRGLERCDGRVKVRRDFVVESQLDGKLPALGGVGRGDDRRRDREQVHAADNGPRGLGVLEHVAIRDHLVADRVARRGPADVDNDAFGIADVDERVGLRETDGGAGGPDVGVDVLDRIVGLVLLVTKQRRRGKEKKKR